jgi:hypothetical protein
MLKSLTCLAFLVCLTVPGLANSTLEGHFYLSKQKYLAGEPVFLMFEVQNKGDQPVMIKTGNPWSFCGGYKIEVQGAKSLDSLGCQAAGGGSCGISYEVLKAGSKHIDRILLNESYDLRQAGNYSLHVSHGLRYGASDEDGTLPFTDETRERFDWEMEIVLEASRDGELRPEFQKYMLELHSDDARQRNEAANVIANLAPIFMEREITHMLDMPNLRYFGVRGLRNLGTPSAHQALLAFVKNSPPTQVSGAYQDAIRYLGEIGDANDLPVLLQAAHENSPGSFSQEVAMESAGRAGCDDAVPLLVEELKNTSVEVRQAAVRALYLTRSRSAVPILIALLRSPDERVSGTAEFGLEVLTHHAARQTNSTAAVSYWTWTQWWNIHRNKAEIFKYDQCGDVLPLD